MGKVTLTLDEGDARQMRREIETLEVGGYLTLSLYQKLAHEIGHALAECDCAEAK